MMTTNNTPIPDNVTLYTVREVATILKSNKNAVYQLIHSGALPCVKFGKIKVRHDALARFLEKAEGYDYTDPYDVRRIA